MVFAHYKWQGLQTVNRLSFHRVWNKPQPEAFTKCNYPLHMWPIITVWSSIGEPVHTISPGWSLNCRGTMTQCGWPHAHLMCMLRELLAYNYPVLMWCTIKDTLLIRSPLISWNIFGSSRSSTCCKVCHMEKLSLTRLVPQSREYSSIISWIESLFLTRGGKKAIF